MELLDRELTGQVLVVVLPRSPQPQDRGPTPPPLWDTAGTFPSPGPWGRGDARRLCCTVGPAPPGGAPTESGQRDPGQDQRSVPTPQHSLGFPGP